MVMNRNRKRTTKRLRPQVSADIHPDTHSDPAAQLPRLHTTGFTPRETVRPWVPTHTLAPTRSLDSIAAPQPV